MIPQGTDLWLKTGFGLAAVLFLTSLPTWALGVILLLGLMAKAAVRYIRDQERERDAPTASSDKREDASSEPVKPGETLWCGI